MTAHGQRVLMAHLVDARSLDVLANDGLSLETVPTPGLRPVVSYALDYYFASGCASAPSVTLLREHYGDALDEAEISIERPPDDSIESALADLKSSYVHRRSTDFLRRFATDMGDAEHDHRLGVVSAYAGELVGLSLEVQPRHSRIDVREAGKNVLRNYEAREAQVGEFHGAGLGLDPIDAFTYGVHDGELAILAAGPKVGKSYMQCWIALRNFQRGKTVCLFTLENSVAMTIDRIACMAMGVDATAWQRGQCTEEEKTRMTTWVGDIANAPNPLWVLAPDLKQRSFPQMVREAQIREADVLLIDQLTFVETRSSDSDRRPKWEQIGDALHTLKALISTGQRRMPCLLTHQINRDGVKASAKTGHLELHHMAEAAEVERTADFIFGLYRGIDSAQMSYLTFQMLGARRTTTKNWRLSWRPEVGHIRVTGEEEFNDA